jgi:hypothetical protein
MNDGRLRFHIVGKGLGDGRWEEGISVEPRGLSPWGIILKYYSKRHVNIMFYPKFFLERQETSKWKEYMLKECMQFHG